MSPLVKARRNRLLMAFIGLGILLAVLAPSNFAQNRPIPVRPTDIPREEVVPVIPTEIVQPEVIATDVPQVQPEQPQQPEQPTQPEQPANEGNDRPVDTIKPLLQETFCRLNINNGGDTNPFSFQFVATGSANIVGYAWDVDAPSATDSTAATYNHTYTAAGTYNISLTCTPTVGAPMVLSGVVTVSAPVVSAFYFPDGNQYEGVPPFTVDAINASTGSGLTYTWRLSGNPDPLVPGIVPDVNTTDYSPTITSADFVAAGFGADGPAVIYFHLTVEDPVSGLSAVATRSVSFVPPPPLYDFTLTPSDGQAPLAVTVNVVALPGSGPVNADPNTAFVWTFTGGTPPTGTGAASGTSYATDGLYTVVLNYVGPGGGGSVTKSVNVFVDGEPVESLFSYEIIGGSGPITVCFNNESSGPIINSEWDFESDGNPVTFDVVDNAPVVCFDYPTGGFKTVQLVVRDQEHVTSGGVSGSSSSSTLSFDLTASPIAAFTFAPTSPITQGTNVNFTDQSDTTGGGPVDTWAWDFNGDGVTDSTLENPTNIPFTQIGGNVIRLTVTGPGGSSFVEQIIQVNRLEIVCAIGGPGAFSVLPTAGGQTYTANITNALGRPITYTWTVTGSGTGLPINQSGASNTLTVDWSTVGFGSFQVSLVATTQDGSICDASRTVTRLWTPLDCTMTNTLPSPIYPTGGTATFTAAHGSTLNGRPIIGYDWYLDNVLVQSGASNTYTYTIPNSSAIVSEPHSVRYVVIVDNTATAPGYTPATSSCEETTNFTVVGWPTLVCASIGGSGTPVPVNADTGNSQTQNYTANITGVAGRTVTYTWTVSDGVITTPNPRTNNNQATVQWNTTAGSLAPAPANDSISVVVNITNPDGTPVTCNMARNNIAVTYNRLVCNGPFGDTNVVVGEFANHSYTFTNSYGRNIIEIVWTLEQESTLGANDWAVIDTLVDNTAPFDAYTNYQFNTPDASYRLSYTASVAVNGAIPADNCISNTFAISTYGVGVGFECESGLVGATNLNTTPPFNAAATYVYYIDMDNSNLLPLEYVWTLTDADGTSYTLRDFINSTNANIYSTNDGIAANGPLSLAELGPIGPGTYTLTVTITDSSGSTAYTCNRSATLNVGFVDALYSYAITGGWTNTALPINTEICLTNTSTHAPTAPASHPVQYLWTVELVGGGTQTFTTENIACFSYTTPGTYTVTVQISTADGTPSDTYSLDFSVYGIQTISIGRTAPVNDFSASQSFTSNGNNLTGQYNWVFDRLTPTSNPAFATRTNNQNPNNVGGFTPGTYRATVSNSGPLGNVSASLEFEILAANTLRARFTPSQWAGIAPMNVCFTDNSVSGTPILQWEWDLNGDGTYETMGQNPGCFTYNTPGTATQVRLRVTNAAFSDIATNTIRTYTPQEASQNFRIEPQGGSSFCFVPQLVNSTLVSWDYGDGNTAGPLDPACHIYGASGTYLVTMCFTSNIDGTPGCITRPVPVTGTTPPTPNLSANGTCSALAEATFTVTNNGSSMATADEVRIYDASSNLILIAPLQLASGTSANYTVNGYYGTLTLLTTDVVVTANTNCPQPPFLTATHVCLANGFTTFTVSNVAPAETAANQPYTVTDGGGATVASGTLNIPVGGSQNITVNSFGPLTLSSTGPQGPTTVISETSDCANPPILVGSHVCLPNGFVSFTVTNNSPDTAANQSFTVTDGGGATVTSGTLNIAPNGGTQVVNVNQFGPLTLSTDNSATQGVTTIVSTPTDCANPPILTGDHVCLPNGFTVFTITNTSPDTAANQPFTVTDSTSTVITSGTLNIAANGGTQVINANSFGPLTFNTDNGSVQGVTTIVSEPSDCPYPPILSGGHVCQANGFVRFTVTNDPTSDTAANQSYTVVDGGGATIATGTLNIPVGGSQVILVESFGPLTLVTDNSAVQGVTTVVTEVSDCPYPPILTAASACAVGGVVTFTVTNTSPDTAANQPYEVRRTSDNQMLTSGLITAAPNGGTQTITVPGAQYNQVALTSASTTGQGVTTVINDTEDCLQPPVIVGSSVCQPDGTAIFTIRNNSGESAANQPYTITDGGGATVTSGTLTIAPSGGQQTITVGAPASYGPLTFSSTGPEGPTTVVNVASNCNQPPTLSAVASCAADGVASFTITNASTETAASQSYVIRNAVNDVVQFGTLNIPAGGSQVLTVTSDYTALTLTSSGTQGPTTSVTANIDCDAPPVLTPSVVCELDGTALLTVTNTSTETDANQPYEVRDESGTVVDSGTLVIPANGGSQTITITGVVGTITLTSTGTQGATTILNFNTNCNEPPVLTGGPTCSPTGTAIFTVTNSSTGSDANQPYTIVEVETGTVIRTGTLSIPANGGTQVIEVENNYGELSFETAGSQGVTTELTIVNNCTEPARLSVLATCTSTAAGLVAEFVVTNTSSEGAADQGYSITDGAGAVVSSGQLQVEAGRAWETQVPGSSAQFTFVTGDPGSVSSASASVVCRTLSPDTTFVSRPSQDEWEAINGGGSASVCPDWMVYHTDQTGDWELFRYGNGDNDRLASFDRNLSQGRGENVTDMAPTRSPDGEWIAFTSNRDSDFVNGVMNWEIYVAKVDNTVIRRVTFNTTAYDLEPVWSPDGRSLVFESDRDGNWELYQLDLTTGVETRLTDNGASDINAFWLPDSSAVVFQSNREGDIWQVFRLDIGTQAVTRITDGAQDSHDPEVSFDGTKVAYRAINTDGRSVIYAANIDGSEAVQVSDSAANSMNHTWSPDDSLIAYQSDLDDDMDIYVWEVETELTRLVTDNTVADYAPTWWCDGNVVVFTSDVLGEADIFNTPALAIDAEPIIVETEANQMTTEPGNHIYPLNTPSEENASREAAVRIWIIDPPLSATRQ